MTSAPSPAERRRLRAEFEARERARMGLPPKATATAEQPRRIRRADAELRRLVDLGHTRRPPPRGIAQARPARPGAAPLRALAPAQHVSRIRWRHGIPSAAVTPAPERRCAPTGERAGMSKQKSAT
jgi:hypothetical protein